MAVVRSTITLSQDEPPARAPRLDGVFEDALGAEVVDAPAEEDAVGCDACRRQHVGARVLAGELGYLALLRRDALLALRQELDVPAEEEARFDSESSCDNVQENTSMIFRSDDIRTLGVD